MIDIIIGLRNLGRNRRRTVLSGLLMAFGVLCLIVFQGLKVGMHDQMIRSTTSLDCAIFQIHAPDYRSNRSLLQPITDHEALLHHLQQQQIVYGERLKTAGLLLAGPQSSMVAISGIVPEHEKEITQISRQLEEGSYLARADGIVLSKSLCQALSLTLGDSVTLMAQDSGGRPALTQLTLQGIFSTGLPGFDDTHVYIRLDAAQKLLKAEQVVSEIAIQTPLENQTAVEKTLATLLTPEQKLSRWQELLPDLVQLIELNDTTMSILIVIVFSLVGMGILNTMTMITYERFDEFGILSAIGYPSAGILRMVLSEAVFLGTGAAIIGACAGVAVCFWLGRHGLDLSHFTSNNQYFTNAHVLYPRVRGTDVLTACAMACATGIISSFMPAWKASRLNPVEALRHL